MGHEYVKENETFNTSRNGVVPKPTQADVNAGKFLKADGTWGEGGGGGTGDVEDVYVNGESVVDDEDKIAKITSYKEVTQAEYNALPSSKETDGVLYCIKDVGGADGFPPLIYSDEEREVGVWRDGKPLYQKTIAASMPEVTTDGTFVNGQVDISDTNIEYIANFVIILYMSSNGQYYILPYINNSGRIAKAFVTANNNNKLVTLVANGTVFSEAPVTITLWYTKTTDTPGSGTWGVQGSLYKVLKIASYSLTPSLVQSQKNLIKTFTVPYAGYYNIGIREVYNRNTNRSWLQGDITSEKGVFLDTDSYQYTDVRYDGSGYTQFVRSIPIYISDITAEISFYLWGNGYSPNSVKIVVNKIG